MTLINVASSVILEGEDYGLRVSMNMKITGPGSSALPEYGGFGCSMIHFILRSAKQRRERH